MCLYLPSVSLPPVKLTSYTSSCAPLGLGGARCWIQVLLLSSVPFSFHQRSNVGHGWVPKLTKRSGNLAAPVITGDRLVGVNLSLGTQDLRARGQQISSLTSQLPPPVPAISWGHWEGRQTKKAQAQALTHHWTSHIWLMGTAGAKPLLGDTRPRPHGAGPALAVCSSQMGAARQKHTEIHPSRGIQQLLRS